VLIIVLHLTFTGEFLIAYRPILTAICTVILIYYFLSDYGLEVKKYPKLPMEVISFVIIISLTILISFLSSINLMYSVIALGRVLLFFLFCYLLFSQIKTYKDIYYYIFSLFFSVIIIGGSIIYEFFEKGTTFFIKETALIRFAGIYGHPNNVGLILLITIPINLAIIFLDSKIRKEKNIYFILFLFFQLVLLLLSDSRASMLAVTVSTILLLIFSSNKVRIYFTSLVVFILINLLLFTDFLSLTELFLRSQEIGSRDLAWTTGVEVISNNFVWGTGADTYDEAFYSNIASSKTYIIALNNNIKATPHNLFIYFWSENGILGLITVCYFFYMLSFLILKLFKDNNSYKDRIYALKISFFTIGVGVFLRAFVEISGIMTYGYITRDLPIWMIISFIVFFSQNQKAIEAN
jgi:O-antigen ligase